MKLEYSYRGNKTELCSEFRWPTIGLSGQVVFSQTGWTDGNQKIHRVAIEPHELLGTAKACLLQLSELSGVDYKIAVVVDGNSNWLERKK